MNKEFIKRANVEAKKNALNNFQDGGPFGAVIVKDGNIVGTGHNTVISSKDSTAHAEINAIREACKNLNTHDLSGCQVYVNAEPCPMCLSAIIWSNIKRVYYANSKEDAAQIGFRDDMIYDFIKEPQTEILNIERIEDEEAANLFEEFKNNDQKTMY